MQIQIQYLHTSIALAFIHHQPTLNIKLTCCQDHMLTENIWFVWSETSYSGDEWRCHGCGTTNNRIVKIELLSQWKLEAEFRNFASAGYIV